MYQIKSIVYCTENYTFTRTLIFSMKTYTQVIRIIILLFKIH